MNLNNLDLDSVKINGYTLDSFSPLEKDSDQVLVAYGERTRDHLPVVAKLSYQGLRLEREYHIAQRLYRLPEADQLLSQPLEKVNLPQGLIAIIFRYEGTNRLDNCQPNDLYSDQSTEESTLISLSSTSSPCLELESFLEFAIQCCDCLEFIHKHQIVHGEIKLNAFLWPEKSTVKLWNFGSGSRSLETNLTSEGWRKTVHRHGACNFLQMLMYMSPEQTGRTTFQPDHRTDLYSIGITFYVILTQSLPFVHNSPMEIVHNVMNRRLSAVHEIRPDLPMVLSAIIDKLTNKSPDERYTSAHGLREDLKEIKRQLDATNDPQSISPFNLGKYDIASVFTLPNGCFGRRREVDFVTGIVRKTAYLYGRNMRNHSSRYNNLKTILTPLNTSDTTTIIEGSSNRINNGMNARGQHRRQNINAARWKKPTEMVAIYGDSGVGKSTLVKSIQQAAREYGYIAIAKFDTRQPTPYGCILRCLSIFFKNILGESQAEFDRFSSMLKTQLGPQASKELPTLLLDNVPEIRAFLGEPEDGVDPDLGNEIGGNEIKMRFHSAFLEIFQVMVNYKFVTLFLEDLHQADEASIELLDSLIAARLDLLVIVTYRTAEHQSMISTLLSNDHSVVNYVKLENMDQNALMDLVRTTMHRHKEIDLVLLTPLVDFITKKTKGNPFYACQLLTTLEKKGLIYFTWEQSRWEYNLQEIEKALQYESVETSDDINIEFLVRRLRELPADGQRFLKWAAFIGDKFSYETVRHLMMDTTTKDTFSDAETDIEEDITTPITPNKLGNQLNGRPTSDAINGLQSALQQGFIHAASNDEFGFSHDRYSQAAMLLSKPEKRDKIHLKIATYFMDDPEVDTFWVADHLKAALHLIQLFDNKSKHRAILIRAGDRAYNSGAHSLAFSYYSAGKDLLPTDPWNDGPDGSYQETLHLYTQLAEISWFMGYDLTQPLLTTILQNAKSAIDRAAAYRLQHRHQWSSQNMQGRAYILMKCLRELGANNVSLDLTDMELQQLYQDTHDEVLEMGLDNIFKLPVCENHLIRTRLSIMEEMCIWGYWMNDIRSVMAVSLLLVKKTFDQGTISPSTGVGLVFYGMAAMVLYKDYEFGQKVGQVGVTLCNKYGGNSECARAKHMYGAYLSIWKGHYRDAMPMFHQALKQALLGGDRISATFSHLHMTIGMLFGGEPLSDTLREAKMCLDEVDGWNKTNGTSVMAMTTIRAVLALQGKTKLTQDAIFDDNSFNETEYLNKIDKQIKSTVLPMYWFYGMKLIILMIFGFHENAVLIGHQYVAVAVEQPSFRHTHWMIFFYCVAMVRWIRQDQNKDAEFRPLIMQYRKKLEEWAMHSKINLQMFVTMIDAELSSLSEKDIRITEQLYDQAIDEAKAGNWLIETNVMYEFAGEYYMRNGSRHVAALLLEKAITGYRHQGCYGKANQLAQTMKNVFGTRNDNPSNSSYTNGDERTMMAKSIQVQTEPLSSSSSLPNRDSVSDFSLAEQFLHTDISNQEATPEETLLALDVVDLASILKSSQVISSEMNFELLMKQMLQIILENSGAESGVIIIKENSSFLIMGTGSQTEGCRILKKPKALSEEADSVVTRVTRYAIHAQESLLISDIQQDSRFSDCETSAKSVICTPITHKSAIVGCIYIEGGVGSLTFRHEVVLRLLSQQVGISVTNALLFKSIQKVTYANVKMIENQKAALEEARKSKEAALRAMKLKADFLANMSHELRTPFSGFYGMISLLSETSLDGEQLDIVHTAKESCEMLLKIIDDLLNFSKLEAGKVSLDLGPLVVEEVIADTIEILSSLAARKGLELAYIVDQNVPKTVIGDSSRLRQILTNLLGNAIKFTHQGGVVIRCHLVEEVRADDLIQLKFEVIDTGIGIRPEQQRNLFEPFSQVDGSTTRMYGGTGLGLSICLQLVRLMMGTMNVESQPNCGSNFWFSIVVEKNKKSTTFESCANLVSQLSRYNILLATYHDHTSTMVKSLLPELKVNRTSDVQHAVSRALQDQHDILLLDIPPTPNSFIAQQLQSVDDDPECELHIILLYAPATEGHKVAAEAINGASDRRGRTVKMAKPARRAKLLRMLEQLVEHPRHSSLLLQQSDQQHQQQQQQQQQQQLQHLYSRSTTPQQGSRISDYSNMDELAYFKERPVLIAEDNMVAQKLLRKQLEKMGFEVESANNGEEAVRLYQERPADHFSVGFFDHHMPKCDGVEATKRIRALESNGTGRLPIIALTADVQLSAREICMNAKMDGYLTKPLITKDLVSTLRDLNPTIDTKAEMEPLSPLSSSLLTNNSTGSTIMDTAITTTPSSSPTISTPNNFVACSPFKTLLTDPAHTDLVKHNL
ncbi:uncharacterized protein BX664DRAFT_281490 [Halteromyces radiatus]|uniref:uncharacterized protein n=1 Tax=Halteromyces radiatus TaxID=101107 RepID=UPI00221E5A58|nr:uncharacterized protein BX664DRAFT_281490 [Halteromyces radiatus]KAI8090060.1 hypothetical protein BX664DRAFT_281490 [Halteromyces radiatus]